MSEAVFKGIESLRLDSDLGFIVVEVSDKSIAILVREDGYECGFSGHKLDAIEIRDLLIRNLPPSPTGHWTTQPPTEPGWYWYKPEEDRIPEAVYLSIDGHGFARARVQGAYRRVSGSGATGLWYSESLSVPGANASEGK